MLLIVALVALVVGSLGCGGSRGAVDDHVYGGARRHAHAARGHSRFGEVDPATGLHVTGTPQVVDAASYRLKVTGKVAKELSLSYAELLALPKQTATPTLLCPGEFTDTATWSGAPLHTIIEMAGVQPGAVSLIMTGADGYATTISLDDGLLPQNFLAYELEGKTLPALHGFPIRAVFPDEYGAYWVKWLLQIEVR